jgi:PKD repeat protein
MIDFPPVLDNHGNFYIVTKKDDFLYAVKPDGSLYWKVHINGHISTPGEYNVYLIISRPDNTSTIVRRSYITVIDILNSKYP